MTETEAVAKLDALDPSDREVSHIEADEVLLEFLKTNGFFRNSEGMGPGRRPYRFLVCVMTRKQLEDREMAAIREERRIYISTDPDELRRLADKMEQEFPKKQAGDSTVIGILAYLDEVTVYICADQEWFAKQ